VFSEILTIGCWRHLANAPELPIEVGKIRQSDLLRDHAHGEVGLPQSHAGAADAKFTKVATHTFAGVFHEEAMKGSW
jgi:hypothetical protein